MSPTRASTRAQAGSEAAHVVFALRVVLAHDALRVVAQVGHAELVVALDHDEQRFLDRRRVLVGLDGELRAIDGGEVGAALHVVAGDMHLMRGQRIDQILHAQDGIRRVFAVREAAGEFLNASKASLADFGSRSVGSCAET